MLKKNVKILNKRFQNPVTCLTAYSASVAKLIDGMVDIILIGDSVGTTLYGMKNTQMVTLDMMQAHGVAVVKNINESISVIDMPYKTYTTNKLAYKNASLLLKKTKAKMLKIEVTKKNLSVLKYLSNKGFNIIAHIGVTPQSFKDFKKIRILGKKNSEKERLLSLAVESEKAGAKVILLECITEGAAKKITSTISIPTIGIGSSSFCDGQILVFDDLINIDKNNHTPKFVKKYMNFGTLAKRAVANYVKDVKKRKFPNKKYTYQ